MNRYLLLISLIFVSLFLMGFQCSFMAKNTNKNANLSLGAVEEIKLTTSDGLNLAGSYFPAAGEKKYGIILVHMYNNNRHDWDNLAVKLQKQGFEVLTFDLRGHGQSEGDLDKFTNSDYQKMVFDVEAAKKFLKEKDRDLKIKLVGASIGANIVLNYAVMDPEIEAVALLSPGLEYHGVTTVDAITQYKKSLLIVASQDDKYSYTSSRKLFDTAPDSDRYKYFQVYKNAGHGTHMLTAVPELGQLIIDFLEDTLKVK